MVKFSGIAAVVTDIEGTTSSISFVHDVLFPYAAKHLPEYVRKHAEEPEVREQLDAVAREAALSPNDVDALVGQLLGWIRDDVKATPLKALQGKVWEAGYRNRDYRAHVFGDVGDALKRWKHAGLKLFVYSSGSVLAQKLFFEFSEAGNLLPLFDGHFDTTTGPKRDSRSYTAIAGATGFAAPAMLFLSDVVAELDAASRAGFQVCLLERPGNAAVAEHSYPVVSSFHEIQLAE